jgi:hypothetical protein
MPNPQYGFRGVFLSAFLKLSSSCCPPLGTALLRAWRRLVNAFHSALVPNGILSWQMSLLDQSDAPHWEDG